MLGYGPFHFDYFSEIAAEYWWPGEFWEIAEGFWSHLMAVSLDAHCGFLGLESLGLGVRGPGGRRLRGGVISSDELAAKVQSPIPSRWAKSFSQLCRWDPWHQASHTSGPRFKAAACASPLERNTKPLKERLVRFHCCLMLESCLCS